jgi:predicted membrane channel-forming protein YqfA (hemolysin III family)
VSELFAIIGIGWVVLAWFTHVVVSLKTASWGFLLAGAIFFPVGCVHGTGIWFGVF